MDRITNKQLDYLVNRINELTGSPLATYTKDSKGQYKANPGNYHINGAYGGIKLVQMSNKEGGICNISTNGFGTKRQLYDFCHAFLLGIETTK